MTQTTTAPTAHNTSNHTAHREVYLLDCGHPATDGVTEVYGLPCGTDLITVCGDCLAEHDRSCTCTH